MQWASLASANNVRIVIIHRELDVRDPAKSARQNFRASSLRNSGSPLRQDSHRANANPARTNASNRGDRTGLKGLDEIRTRDSRGGFGLDVHSAGSALHLNQSVKAT